jgi:hypothetical protein
MTPHLSSNDQIAALEGTLAKEKESHVAACAACRDEIARLRALVDAMRSDAVPEPSPLFWEHFSGRVRAATAAEAPASASRFGWRVWIAVASAAMAFLMILAVRQMPSSSSRPALPNVDAANVTAAGVGEATDAEPLAAVMQMASSLSSDDLSGVVSIGGGGTPLVEDLSPAEREAFVRLLHVEMEKVQ